MGALVRYHGGKVRIAEKIIGLFPAYDCYVEPFGGGGAVLLAKPRARLEVYNDLDGDKVALFRALRDAPAELAEAIALTPFARVSLCCCCPVDGTTNEHHGKRGRRSLPRPLGSFGAGLCDECADAILGIGPDAPTVAQAGNDFRIPDRLFPEVALPHAGIGKKGLNFGDQCALFLCHVLQSILYRGHLKCFLSRTCDCAPYDG